MEEKITFGKFIARKRREKALTQRELAEQLYVTESAVSKWERGVSYPDITLVVPLCRALDVTEHELIAGAEDVQQRAADRQAQQYRALVRAWSWTFYILYAVSLAVCFAVNLIVEHRLSWFFLVFGGEALAFSLTSLPLIVPKNKGMWTLAGFFASLCLLLAICCIYVGGDWLAVTLTAVSFGFCVVFAPLILRELSLPAPLGRHRTLICFVIDTALLFLLVVLACLYTGIGSLLWTTAFPVTLYSLLLPWGLMAAIRYVPVNGFFKTALCLTEAGVWTFLLNSVLAVFIDGARFSLAPWNWADWSDAYFSGNVVAIFAAACLAFALVFAAGGIVLETRRRKE